MNGIRYCLPGLCLVLATAAGAQTEIHKCTDADGGIVYSQLPCAPKQSDSQSDPEVEEQPADSPESRADDYDYEELVAQQMEAGPAKSEEEVAACKKRYRDQIDLIDAEIQREYAEEKADDYKQRLLQLTRQLRQCEGS